MTPEHEPYEELCALAAGGLLEGGEFVDFKAHMKECSKCRADYEELLGLVTLGMPLAQGTFKQRLAAIRARPMPYSRQRFLRRARAEGVVFSREVETLTRPGQWDLRSAAVLAPVAVLILAAASLAVYHFRATPDTSRAKDSATAQQVAELQRKNAALTVSLNQLNQSLAAGQRENHDLRKQLERASTTSETLQQARGQAERSSSQNVQLQDELHNQEKLLADARNEAARSSLLRLDDEASMVEQQTRITELTNKLRIASATLDQERQMVASGRDVRELMASRELHVIDVRDTDPNGNPSTAFGRVFLTEGKSLTFYAFDLNEDRVANAKRSFEVWAVPEAGKNSPRSLGFLRMDAKAHGRWVLRVDNPELIKAISSVFVTIDPATGSREPSGQKMLYAYLAEANHP